MNKKIIALIIAFLVIAMIGASLAYLRSDAGSQNYNTLNVNNFGVDLITDITNVDLGINYPKTDSEGLINTPVTFAIRNNGEITANYKISLVDKTTVSTLMNRDVRYRLKKTVGSNAQQIFEIQNLDDTGLIDTGSIAVGTTITYELVLWQDIDSTANNKTFIKSILVEELQAESLDQSGANYPELLDNMIPVYYEATTDTTGVWKKADSTNKDSNYKWFDYDNQMWANAVTVKASGTKTRDYYLGAASGTTIDMSDITAMWVWIPRYKYVIFNGNNGNSSEQMINVIFEHGKDKTGTVSCVDNISSTDSSSSETCTDTTNGGVIDNKSTYTHPAFTFGTEELTGLWVAKFEVSTDDSTCLTNENVTNCNKSGLNILVKPDQSSLRSVSISNLFLNFRGMELAGNIHGFNQGSSETAVRNSAGSLTGEINGDDNNFDTHMIKNMEWGAVAILSNSKYGKYNNSLYTGDYKEVYMNNYGDGETVFKTGYSAGIPVAAASTSATYLYNNLTISVTGQGYVGAGASTTGNVYGIYDMSGGSADFVMGNMISTSGTYSCGASTNCEVGLTPLAKYYDNYSKLGENTSDAAIFRSKLGDAIKEVKKTTNHTWFGDLLNMPTPSYPWFSRGNPTGAINNNLGIFQAQRRGGGAGSTLSSRPVLAINREMPWLDE